MSTLCETDRMMAAELRELDDEAFAVLLADGLDDIRRGRLRDSLR